MIRKKRAAPNGEYFVCPVYNELIAEKKKVISYDISAKQKLGMGIFSEIRQFPAKFNRLEKHHQARLKT